MPYEDRNAAGRRLTRAEYRQEPYVRAELADGSTADGKAQAWTRNEVLFHWQDEHSKVHNQWVDAARVTRIHRDESRWQDPYDDYAYYYPDLPAR